MNNKKSFSRSDIQDMPNAVSIANLFKSEFGQIYVRHVSENGKELGQASKPGLKLSEIERRGDAMRGKKC